MSVLFCFKQFLKEKQTFGVYLHAPQDGIFVQKGSMVDQNQVLGLIGRSGLAGYPHLHFIVVEGDPAYPYKGIPISFNNVIPADVVLVSNKFYQNCSD